MKIENFKEKFQTVDKYETEKIEGSANDLKSMARQMEVLLEIAKFADENEIRTKRKERFDSLRYPTAPFGPDGKLSKELSELKGKFIQEYLSLFNQFTPEQKAKYKESIVEQKQNLSKENLEKEKKEKINYVLNIISLVVTAIEDGKYDDENRGRLWPDLASIYNQIDSVKDFYLSTEFRDAENRVDYLLEAEKNLQDPKTLKDTLLVEFYKIKEDLYFEIGEKKEKPDWILK